MLIADSLVMRLDLDQEHRLVSIGSQPDALTPFTP
jgi:hypothetical protein